MGEVLIGTAMRLRAKEGSAVRKRIELMDEEQSAVLYRDVAERSDEIKESYEKKGMYEGRTEDQKTWLDTAADMQA